MAACRDNLKGQVVLFFAFSGDRGEAAWITLATILRASVISPLRGGRQGKDDRVP
jgi:hypothetical protein